MNSDKNEYKEALLKILDLSKDSVWYVAHHQPNMLLDVAKNQIAAATFIMGIITLLLSGGKPAPLVSVFIIISAVLCCISYVLSFQIFWGKGSLKNPFTKPEYLQKFAREVIIDDGAPVAAYEGIIASIGEANATNKAISTERVKILRTAAPCIIASFLFLVFAVLAKVCNG